MIKEFIYPKQTSYINQFKLKYKSFGMVKKLWWWKKFDSSFNKAVELTSDYRNKYIWTNNISMIK